jgi:hypothetical protein
VACFNPLLAEERARKRPELLTATEKQLEKIAAATKRPKPSGVTSKPAIEGHLKTGQRTASRT